MKKNILLFSILILGIILIFALKIYNDNRIISNNFSRLYGNKKVCDITIEKDGANVVLEEALIGYYTFDDLPLTDNFKHSFKNRKDIISDINKISDIFSYISVDDNEYKGKICIYASKGLDLFNKYNEDYATIYIYDFSIVNNKIDNIVLFDKYDVSEMTGKKYEY